MNARLNALRFIVESLGASNSDAANQRLRRAIAEQSLDWRIVRGLADAERLTPALWVALRDRGLATVLPSGFRGDLWKVHLLNSLRNKRLKEQALSAIRVLNAIGVQPMILKGGASLFDRTFGDPGSRMMVDLDLLVPRERAEHCWVALRMHEYGPISIDFDYSNHHHLRPLHRPGMQGTVEVHRELLPISVAGALPASLAWKQGESRMAAGATFSLPSPTTRVLHSVLHTAIVDRAFSRADLSLKALFELASLQRSFGERIDWGSVGDTMRAHGLSRALDSWIYSVHQLLGDCIPGHDTGTLRSIVHLERVRLQVRWEWTAWVVDRSMWFSAENIRNRYTCSDRFWPLLKGRARLIASIVGKSVAQLGNRPDNAAEPDSGTMPLNRATVLYAEDASMNRPSVLSKCTLRDTAS
ncbi:MAG: nucleotidyltransferase family protein [Sterolibacteriaceae bacterium]|nr:nucleotidyltransferase family protein [Candidatus Methylophosphatis haderslevensis]